MVFRKFVWLRVLSAVSVWCDRWHTRTHHTAMMRRMHMQQCMLVVLLCVCLCSLAVCHSVTSGAADLAQSQHEDALFADLGARTGASAHSRADADRVHRRARHRRSDQFGRHDGIEMVCILFHGTGIPGFKDKNANKTLEFNTVDEYMDHKNSEPVSTVW